MDPDTNPVDETGPDTRADAEGAPDAPEPDADAELRAAMDEGVEEASEAPPEPEPDPKPVDEPEVPGTPEAAAAEAAKAEKTAADKDKEPEPDKDTEDEIKALEKADGKPLSEGSKDRFRSMASKIKASAQVQEVLEKAGIKDAAEIPALVQRAEDGDYLVKSIEKTGVTPDDFTRLLDYGSIIAAGRKGDRAAVERAFETVGEEYAAIAKALGKDIPGVYDPLAEHADLRTAIEDGDMTQKHALEVAQARTSSAAITQQRQQIERETSAQREQQAVEQQGVASLQQWEQAMVAKDPNYAAKRPALNAKVVDIRKQFPPAQWVAATELAYQALQAPTQPRPASGNPVRPSGPRPTMQPTTFESDADAMDYGIKQASGG